MKAEAELLKALRGGAVDTAVAALERIHDAKQLQAQMRAKGEPTLAGVPATPALGNVLFALAQGQAQLLQTLVTQQSALARAVQGAVADAVGVARPGGLHATQVITWRARLDDTGPARRRFVVRNQKAPAALDLTLSPFARVDSPDVPTQHHATVVVDGTALAAQPSAGLDRSWSTLPAGAVAPGAAGVIATEGAAVVEIELAMKDLLAECRAGRYTAKLRVAMRRGAKDIESQTMTLELVVHD